MKQIIIYGSRATGNKSLMNVASGQAGDIKDLYNMVSQKMGIDFSNVNKLTETALVGQYVDYTTGARQNAAGTFDVMFGNILGDIKTTGGIRDSVAAQFQMLTDLIRVNSDEIASKMGIENTTQSIEAFINSLRSVVFQVGKDGTAMAGQFEGMSEQQIASLLTGVKYNRMMAEQNPHISVSEALGTIYGYKKQVEFSEDNKALYKRFEELRRDRATMGEFEALAQELGFTTKNISKKGNDRTYAWERIDEKTGKILHVGATFNENGGMLPHGNSISYRESDASQANTAKGKYVDLLRQELNLEQQIATLQVKRQSAIINGNTQESVDLATQIQNQEALLELLRMQKQDARFVEDDSENKTIKQEVENEYRESIEGKEIQYKGEAERQKIARKATNSLEKNYEDALKAEKAAELELNSLPKEITQKQIDNAKKKAANIAKKYGTDSDEYKKANLELSQLEEKRNNELFESDTAEKRERAKSRLKQARTERKKIEKEAEKSETTETGKKRRKKELKKIKDDFDKGLGQEMEQDAQFKHITQNNNELNKKIDQRNDLLRTIENLRYNNKDNEADKLSVQIEKIEQEIQKLIAKFQSEDERSAAYKYTDRRFLDAEKEISSELDAKEQDKIAAANKQMAKDELLQQEKRKQQLLAQKSKMVEEQKKLLPISDAYQKKQGEIDEINSQIKGLQNYTWDADKRQIFQNGQLVATLSQEEAIKFQQKYNSELFKTQQMQNEVNKASQKKGFFGSIKDSVNSTLQYMMVWQAGYMIIGKVRQAIQTVINTTKELDKTMTNLQIVTGKTKEETYEMMKTYSSLAQELGGTIGEVSASANEWLRMGYNTAEVNTLITDTMMLSKLGMIDTTKATEYLTSAIKGYGVAVKDASEIVDMATALDMKYAVSSGYILEAMSKTAASAKLAKVEMSDLQSMIAVAGEVTQKDASVIGESFKTAFARYGNVKASAFIGNSDLIGLKDTYSYENNFSENSESMSGVNDIEKVLNKVHIDLREKDMVTWRSYSDILKDIGEGWKTYSDYEKNAITTALFGTRQRENGLVVLENYSRVLQAQEVAVSSVGTAAKKYEAYQNSLEASTKKVSAAIEDLILKLQANGVLKSLSDSLVWLIKNLKIVAPLMLTAFAIGHLDSFILKLNKISYLINSKMLALGKLDIRGLFSGTANKISTGIDSSRNYFEMEQLKGLETKKQLTTAQLMTIEFEKMYNIIKGMSYEEAEQLSLERRKTLEGEKQVASETTETAENYVQEEFEFMQTENDAAQATSEMSQTANDQIQAYLEGNSTTQEFLQLKGEEGQTIQDYLQLHAEKMSSGEDAKQLASEIAQTLKKKLNLSDEGLTKFLGTKFGKNDTIGNVLLQSQGKLTPLNSFMNASGYLMGGIGGWQLFGALGADKIKNPIGKYAVKATGAAVGLGAVKLGASIGTAVGGPLGTAVGAAIGGATMLVGGWIAKKVDEKKQEAIQAAKDELASLEEHYSKASSADTSTNIDRYDELANGVNNLGENVSLTNDEYEEFINLGNELAETFPELVSHTDRFGNSLLGVDGKIGGLREQLSLLLTDLQKEVDTKLLNPKLAKEEFKNAKTKLNKTELQEHLIEEYQKIINGNFGFGVREDILKGAGLSLGDATNKWGLASYDYLNQEQKNKLQQYVKSEYNKIQISDKTNSNEFTSQYLPAVMRESWDYSTLDQNLQEFTNRMAQGLDTSKFDNFDDWKTFIEEKIVKPLKDSKRELTPVLEDLYKFDFEGSNQKVSTDINTFDRYINDLVEFYKKEDNVELYNQIKEKMGIISNSDGTMSNSFGVTVTDKDIISDFLGVENQAQSLSKKLYDKFEDGSRNYLVDTILSNFNYSEASALSELSASKLANIVGDNPIQNLEQYLKDNNVISLQSTISSLKKTISEDDSKEGQELKDYLENYAWDINPEDFDMSKFATLPPDTQRALQDLINKAKLLGVTVGEAYNNVKDLMSLNKYNETSLSVENISSRYNTLNEIASDLRQNKIISPENFDKLSESYPELIEYLGDPDEFIRQVNNILANKSDLIKGSIKEDLSNNESYFEKLADKYKIDYEVYKTYAQLRKDVEKYGDIDFSNLGRGMQQLQSRIKSEIVEAGQWDDYKTFYQNWVDFNGIELETGQTAENAFNKFIITFSKAIPISFKIETDINQLSSEIEKKIKAQSIDSINKAYRDILDAQDTLDDAKKSKRNADEGWVEAHEDWVEAQEDWVEAQEDFAEAQEDWDKAQRDYEKQKRRLEKQARDQRKKEEMQALTDMLERRNLILEKYDKKLDTRETAIKFLDTSDYQGQHNSLNDKYTITANKISVLRSRLAELASITPTSSEQANKIAEEYDNLSSSLIEAESNLYEIQQEMQRMGLDAFSAHLENVNTQFERQDNILKDMMSVLEADTGLLSAWDLVDLNEFNFLGENDITDNRIDYESMLKEQEQYQNQSLAMRRQYLDLLKEENMEENSIFWEDHADSIEENEESLRDAKEAFDDAKEALSDAEETFDDAKITFRNSKEDWEEAKEDWDKAVGDFYETINNFRAEYGDDFAELGIDVDSLFGDQLLKDADNWSAARSIITEEGALIEEAVRKLGGTYSQNSPKSNPDNSDSDEDITEPIVDDKTSEPIVNKDFFASPFGYDKPKIYIPDNTEDIVTGTWSYNDSSRQEVFTADKNGKDKAKKVYNSNKKTWEYVHINEKETKSNNETTKETKQVSNKIIIPAPELAQEWKDGSKEQEIINSLSTIVSKVKQEIETNPELKLSLSDIWKFDDFTTISQIEELDPNFVGPPKIKTEKTNKKTSRFDKLLEIVSKDIQSLNKKIQEELQKVIDECSIPVPKLDPSWTASTSDGESLSNDIYTSSEKAMEKGIKSLEKDLNGKKENLKIPSPKLANEGARGWDTEDGLQGRIINKIEKIYENIGKNDTLGLLTVPPKLDEEAWTTFGENIAKYISDGINNAIESGTIVQVDASTMPDENHGGNVAGTTISSNQIKKGQTLYYDTGSIYGHVGIYDGNGGMYHLIKGKVQYNKLDSLPSNYKFLAAGWNGGVELTPDQVSKMFEQIEAGNNFGKGTDECQGWVAKAYESAIGRYLSDFSPKTIVENHPDWLTSNATLSGNDLTLKSSLLSNLLNYIYSNANSDLPSDLGWISAKYEASGYNADSISNGAGDFGGKSYGIPQFSTTQGSADSFVKFLKENYPNIGNIFGNAKAGTDAFDAAWKIAAQRNSSFGYIQQLYAKEIFVDKQIEAIKKKYGLDMNRSKALLEAVFSAAIQYNNLTPSLLKGYKQGMTDKEIIDLIYSNKLSGVDSHFRSSSKAVRAGVRNRIPNEWKDVLSLIPEYATGTTTNGHQGGPAIVGEGKNSEIVSIPHKSPFIVSDATLFTDMPKGTHVIPIPEYAEGTISVDDIIKNKTGTGVLINRDGMTKDKIIETAKDIYGENADLVLKLSGVDGVISDKLNDVTTYNLKQIDPNLLNNDIWSLITDPNRDKATILEQDKQLLELAKEKIFNNNSDQVEAQSIWDNYMNEYNLWKKDTSNPYYLNYLLDDIKQMENYTSDKYKSSMAYLQENIGKPLEEKINNTENHIEAQRLKITEQNYINDLRADTYKDQIPKLEESYQQAVDLVKNLQKNGADSEIIKEALTKAEEIRTQLVEANSTYDEILNNQLELEKLYSDTMHDQKEYQNELIDMAANLGQDVNVDYADKINNNNEAIQSSLLSIAEIENRLWKEGIERGWTEEKILEEIANNTNIRELKKTINSTIQENKEIFKAQKDERIRRIERNIQKIDLKKPEKWDNKRQISKHYYDVSYNYSQEIEALEEYLDEAENLSLEEYQNVIDQINDLRDKNLQNEIQKMSDLIQYQESIYEALRYRVDEYIDDLELEKEAVSERYDEEINKLTKVNEDKERSIKLSELQQKLDNAQTQKKRVYRTGVGFVYEADRRDVKTARQDLDAFWRQDKIDDLNTAKDIEIKFYDERIEGWNKYLQGIEKQYKRFEAQQNHDLLIRELGVNSLEELDKLLIQDRDTFLIDYDYQNSVYGEYNTKYTGLFDNFLTEYETYLRNLDKLQETELSLKREIFKTSNDDRVQSYSDLTTSSTEEWVKFRNKYGIDDFAELLNDPDRLEYFNNLGYNTTYIAAMRSRKDVDMEDFVTKNSIEDIIKMIKNSDLNNSVFNETELYQALNRKMNKEGKTEEQIVELFNSLQPNKLSNMINNLVEQAKQQSIDGKTAEEISRDMLKDITNMEYFQYLDKQTQGFIKNQVQGIKNWDLKNLSTDEIVAKLGELSTNIVNAINGETSQLSSILTPLNNNLIEKVKTLMNYAKIQIAHGEDANAVISDVFEKIKGTPEYQKLDKTAQNEIENYLASVSGWDYSSDENIEKLNTDLAKVIMHAGTDYADLIKYAKTESEVKLLNAKRNEKIKMLGLDYSQWSDSEAIDYWKENKVVEEEKEEKTDNGYDPNDYYNPNNPYRDDNGNYIGPTTSNPTDDDRAGYHKVTINGVTTYVPVDDYGKSNDNSLPAGYGGKTTTNKNKNTNHHNNNKGHSTKGRYVFEGGKPVYKAWKDGTDGTASYSFLAGEEGPEVGVYPDGTVVTYGTNGPEIYENQPLGTTIFTAEESAKILGTYKNGTKNKGLREFTGLSLTKSLDYYKYLMKDNLKMPEYFSTIPKYENTNSQKGDTIYEIHTVELPNVQNASTFWEELNNGVRRHIRDK